MKTLITRIKRLALALCFVTPLVSWAEGPTNPVTDETETYANVFSGETTEWNEAGNWTPEGVPFVSGGTYTSALVDGKAASTETSIDGWNLQVGAYNGASITWLTLGKIQGDTGMWLTVDGTSSIVINGWGGGNLGQDGKTLTYYVANEQGVTWNADLDSGWDQGLTMNYYLAGEGSVAYQKLERAAQVIKQADVALSGNEKSVQSKTLVSFTSTDKTFTADAAIKVKNGDNVLKTVYLTSVTAGEGTTLTTDSDVGACELVQTSTGIVLYYVDGDPAAVVVDEKTYKPSININFTNGAGNGLTTGADVGLEGYAVPGTSWNNYVVANSTFSTVNAVDSTGAASAMSGVSVTISNVSGSWSCSGLTASSDFRQSYIDESAAKSTPTVTVTGIPYYKYRVLVYHSTDTANVPFGYDTINGTNYTYVKDDLSEGTTAWGASGPANSANAIAEGSAEAGNVLVTEALSGSTLTVVGHRAGGDSSARGCIAAIQIIEVKADVGENDLEIAVDGEKEYTVTAEDAEKTGTVYLTGSGTLTLAGENKISAATINVGDLVTLVVDADRLDGTTFTGGGTVVYDGTKPASGKGWTDSTWTGTVWVKNIPTSSNERKDWDLALYGNADSTLRFTGVNLYFPNNTTTTFPGTVDIDGEGMNVCDGYGGSIATFARLTGSGTLSTTGGSSNGNGLTINDASGFTGTITLTKYKVIVGTSTGTSASGVLQVESGKSITVAGATAPGGFVINGTLVANGTLASSASPAVSGAGTVVFGGVPSPTGDTWWKNSAWTGTVEIKGASITGTGYAFNDYGNAGSTVKLTNCSGWLTGDYTCVPALEIGGTFTWNDGWSGLEYTFKVGTLKGSGTISIPNQGAATAVWQITDDWSGFTGAVVGNNNAGKRVLVFGSTLPASVTAGEIYVSEGATLNLDNSSSAWWGVGMGFVVDGTVKATNRSKWGGGTTMTLGDTGILEITRSDSAYSDDGGTDYGNVTGTGTIKFSGSGFTVLSQSIPTSLTFAAEKDSGSVVPVASATIGSLTGSKGFRSDWGINGDGGRYLTIKQSKDTDWDGSINVGGTHRLTGVVVDPGDSTTGTLTLTATQTASSTLTVNGSVNLTGTWVGATTVAGTIGGTGTLTGDLTFSEGSTLKAYETGDADGLVVSGTVACPEAKVTVDVSAIEPEADVALLKATDLDANKFALAEGTPEGYTLDVVGGVLTLVVPQTKVTVSVPAVENTTVTVVVGEETIGTAAGNYDVDTGSVVTVTYVVNDAYEHTSGELVYNIDTASETTCKPDIVTTQYVARNTNVKFTTVADAIANAKTSQTPMVSLLADISDEDIVVDAFIMLMGNFTVSSSVTVSDGGQLQVMGPTLDCTLTIENGGVYGTIGGTLGTVVAEDGAAIQLTTLNETTAPLTITTLTVEGELTVVSSYPGAARGTTYKALSYVTANATIAQGATVAGGNEWSADTVVDGDNTVVTLEITAVAKVGDEYFDDAQDAVDAAVASGNPVEFIISDPGTVTLGAGETLSVKGVNIPTVALAGDLETPPYYLETTPYDAVTGLTIYTVAEYVAQITGGAKFESVTAALEAAETGDTVVVLVDTCERVYAEVNNNVTLDINGKTMTSPVDDVIIQNGTGTLTIKDTATTPGLVQSTINGVDLGVAVWARQGTVVVQSGVFENNSNYEATLYVSNGAYARVEGGTFRNVAEGTYHWKQAWAPVTLNVQNGHTDGAGAIIVTGGSFTTDPANGDDKFGGTFVASGYAATEDAGVWTVAKAQGLDPASEDPSVESDAENVEDAVTDAKENIVAPTGVDKAVYAEYFKYDVAGDSGAYTVTIVGFADEVVENTDDDALDALQAAVDSEATEFTVAVPAGLYYKIETFDTLGGTAVDFASGLSNGTTEAVDKPTGTTQGFIKVQISTKAFN